MDKFIRHCDKIEDEILKMITNMKVVLKSSAELYEITSDQNMNDPDNQETTSNRENQQKQIIWDKAL